MSGGLYVSKCYDIWFCQYPYDMSAGFWSVYLCLSLKAWSVESLVCLFRGEPYRLVQYFYMQTSIQLGFHHIWGQIFPWSIENNRKYMWMCEYTILRVNKFLRCCRHDNNIASAVEDELSSVWLYSVAFNILLDLVLFYWFCWPPPPGHQGWKMRVTIYFYYWCQTSALILACRWSLLVYHIFPSN